MGESGERGWILVIDVSSDRPMGSDHTLSQNFSHKEFFKKYSYLVILNRLEETNISICFSINRFFKASSLFLANTPPRGDYSAIAEIQNKLRLPSPVSPFRLRGPAGHSRSLWQSRDGYNKTSILCSNRWFLTYQLIENLCNDSGSVITLNIYLVISKLNET